MSEIKLKRLDFNELINKHNNKHILDAVGFAVACVGTKRVRYLKQTGDSAAGPLYDWTPDEREAAALNHSNACKALNKATIGTRLWGYCRLVVVADERYAKLQLPTINGY